MVPATAPTASWSELERDIMITMRTTAARYPANTAQSRARRRASAIRRKGAKASMESDQMGTEAQASCRIRPGMPPLRG
jgi:hypothetical protein